MPASSDVIGRLCRYYLECLSLEQDNGVSLFAQNQDQAAYAELSALPQPGESIPLEHGSVEKNLLRRVRNQAAAKTVWVGYPVRLRYGKNSNGGVSTHIEPVFLLGLEDLDSESGPILSAEPPSLNLAMLKGVSQGDAFGVAQEAALLADELGLWEEIADPLPVLASKLRELRSEWDWREQLEPGQLSRQPALGSLNMAGIYNRAIILETERSAFTKGLETELSQLKDLSPHKLDGTALGRWINSGGGNPPPESGAAGTLLEPIPLNEEQRMAIQSAFTQNLTVITGPPGTGKSQVVSGLLINAAQRGLRVLFASKNNKAVDVVEQRVNALGSRPVLLRLGRGAYQEQLSQYLAATLAARTQPEDEEAYRFAQQELENCRRQLASHQSNIDAVMQLRNEVDLLEQQVEPFRVALEEHLFREAAEFDSRLPYQMLAELTGALRQADRQVQPFWTRLFWPLLEKSRLAKAGSAIHSRDEPLLALGLSPPALPTTTPLLLRWQQFLLALELRIEQLEQIRTYHDKRRCLSATASLESHYSQIARLQQHLSRTSKQFWKAWIRLVPARLSPSEREDLGNFSALVRMMVEAEHARQHSNRQLFAKYYSLFPKVAGILNCWAVTSLSARGRIPLEPGFFDLVIIDEASQCDIASALPLLYRAKRAVIIGDPQQLQHISTLSPTRDVSLLQKHDLLESKLRWAYSTNSLFSLASSLAPSGCVHMLLDHHRSHPDIIAFSNTEFYEGRLRVVTRYDLLNPLPDGAPSLRWIHVAGTVTRLASGGASNLPEARAVVQEVTRLILQQGYSGSVGIVTPFRAQVSLLQRLISQHPDSERLSRGTELLCESAHRFQGDERDVMLFSPVVADGIGKGAIHFLQNTGNLFNVAITRARAGLIVVGDASAARTSGISYLARFANYASKPCEDTSQKDPSAMELALSPEYPTVARPELVSEWERVFYRALYQAGLRPLPQFQVEKFALDLTLFAGEQRLAIEVDGERYHKAWNGELLYRDQMRNLRLIELGWHVRRFWVYELRDDMQGCVAAVQNWRKQFIES
jgi:very-short-patch-repair endonuclease